jgi:glycosyl transferase family 9 (putative heptosyltransferase)
MGVGDDIMATGYARGAAARGRRVAFGDGKKLIWGPFSELAFRHNPNIARSLTDKGIEWCLYHKGNRLYNKLGNGRWLWNYDYRAPRGEFFFDERERAFTIRRDVLIEPNVPWHKSVAVNKDWGLENYQRLADLLTHWGFGVHQLSYGEKRLRNVQVVEVPDFRCAAAALAGFDLVITPEGGLHHAAAAVDTRAIVIFGGFIPPTVTGYAGHLNLGEAEGCGSLRACQHCREALRRITVEEVAGHALWLLNARVKGAAE